MGEIDIKKADLRTLINNNMPQWRIDEPWSAGDMKKALDGLQEIYKTINADKKKYIVPGNGRAAYEQLCTYIEQVENATKEGEAINIGDGALFKEAFKKCMESVGMPLDIFPRLRDDISPKSDRDKITWNLQEMHYFRNLFCFLIRARAEHPKDGWKTWYDNDIHNSHENTMYTLIGFEYINKGFKENKNNLYTSEADEFATMIADACRYSGAKLSDAQNSYLKDGFKKDLSSLYGWAEGMSDFDEVSFKEIVSNIKSVMSNMNIEGIASFDFLTENAKVTPVALHKALDEYKGKLQPYVSANREAEEKARIAEAERIAEEKRKLDEAAKAHAAAVSNLEGEIGKANPDFSFDIERFEKDIRNYFKLVSGDAHRLSKYDYRRDIEDLVKYVRDNDFVLKNWANDYIDKANTAEFSIEYNLMNEFNYASTGQEEGLARKITDEAKRDKPSREYIIKTLQRYADTPKQFIRDYVEKLARNMMDRGGVEIISDANAFKVFGDGAEKRLNDNTQNVKDESKVTANNINITTKSDNNGEAIEYNAVSDDSDSNFDQLSNLTPVDNVIHIDRGITFEDDVIEPIKQYCEEEHEFEFGEQLKGTDSSLKDDLDTVLSWLVTGYGNLGLYKDDPITHERKYAYNDALDSDEAVECIIKVKAALSTLRSLTNSIGLKEFFKDGLYNKAAIKKDLEEFRNYLQYRHIVHKYDEYNNQLKEFNTADNKTKWSSFSQEELNEAYSERFNLNEQIAEIGKLRKSLIDKNIYKSELQALKDFDSNQTDALKLTLGDIADARRSKALQKDKADDEVYGINSGFEQVEKNNPFSFNQDNKEISIDVNKRMNQTNVIENYFKDNSQSIEGTSNLNNFSDNYNENEVDSNSNRSSSVVSNDNEYNMQDIESEENVIKDNKEESDEKTGKNEKPKEVNITSQNQNSDRKKEELRYPNNMNMFDYEGSQSRVIHYNEDGYTVVPDNYQQVLEFDVNSGITSKEEKVYEKEYEIGDLDYTELDRRLDKAFGFDAGKGDMEAAVKDNIEVVSKDDMEAVGEGNIEVETKDEYALGKGSVLNSDHLDLSNSEALSWRGRTYDVLKAIKDAISEEHPSDSSLFRDVQTKMSEYIGVMNTFKYNKNEYADIVPEVTEGDYEKNVFEQISTSTAVKSATESLYKACAAYLEKHLDSNRVRGEELKYNKEITGQRHTYGRIRKQAAAAIMAIFAELPEGHQVIKEVDKGITRQNYEKKLHSSDMEMVKESLKRANGTGKAYYDLIKVVSRQQNELKEKYGIKKPEAKVNQNSNTRNRQLGMN